METAREALRLLLAGDAPLWEAIGLSLALAVGAVAAAAPFALAAAYALAAFQFPGRRALLVVLQGFLSFPTVVVGLLLYFLLSRKGPLGGLEILFSPWAMAAGQFLIALPVLAAFSLAALQGVDRRCRETARLLGASPLRAAATEIAEARFGVAAGLLAGFGRVFSEVGCALMVGGNIAGHTRTIPTAIVLETGRGAFAEGVALGFVLLMLALAAAALLGIAQGRGARR